MGNRIYVGNLAFSTTKQSVEAMFASAGDVQEVHIATDRDSGQPRGFGFVTMGSSQAAANAISTLNGAVLDGRALRVNEAQERPQRSGFGGGRPR